MKLSTRKVAILLIGCLLVGCAHASKDAASSDSGGDAMKTSIRAIIYFSHLPTVDDKELVAAISQSCRCQPVFFRQFNSNAMIYEINLSPSLSFAVFEKSLLEGGKSLGVQAVEQDVLMQHQ